MAAICFTHLRAHRARITLLSACGVPVTGTCSTVVTDGLISVADTKAYKEMEELLLENGDGGYCVEDTIEPVLKWHPLVITMCGVDPEAANIMTAEPIVVDDAATPQSVGYRSRKGSAASANFALELWTRLSGQSACADGVVQYGYVLYPWVIQGTMGDVTYEKGVASFVVNARTSRSSPWGTGPYAVDKSEAAATLDFPIPLVTAIHALDHKHVQVTELAAPASACGCVAIPSQVLALGAVGLVVTATHPASALPSATNPVMIDWGDGTVVTVTSGATTAHTYGGAGLKTVRYAYKNFSSVLFTGTITV